MLTTFLVALFLAVIFTRVYVYLFPSKTLTNYLRHKTFLYIHHIYIGILIIAIVSPLLIMSPDNLYLIAILGGGIGLCLDELFAWLDYQNYPSKKEIVGTLIIFLIYSLYIYFVNSMQ